MSNRITSPLDIVNASVALLIGITDAPEVIPNTVLADVLKHEGRYNIHDFLDFIEEKLSLEACILCSSKFDISMTVSEFAEKAHSILKERGAL